MKEKIEKSVLSALVKPKAKRGPKKPHRGNFKPGQSGNPAGNPLVGAQSQNRFELWKSQTPERKKELIDAVWMRATKYGTPADLNFLLNTLFGKEPLNVNVTTVSLTKEEAKERLFKMFSLGDEPDASTSPETPTE